MSGIGALLTGVLALASPALTPQTISFPTADSGTIYADLYGEGEHGVVLVHGARFDKESWRPQARRLARSGFRVLAIDLRGYGRSGGGADTPDPYAGYPLDVLAAVRHLRDTGATTVSIVGGSLGGWAAARASVESERGEIDRLVLLAHSPIDQPERMKGRKLFVVTENDPGPGGTSRLPLIRQQYEAARGKKELVVLEGSAHAQHIFATEQGERLMEAIVGFLRAP